MHIKTLKTLTCYHYNTNSNSSWGIIDLTTDNNMFKVWGKFALQYPKIWTISNDSVFFEDKQPTQVVLKQNYTNMYQVKSHQKPYLRSKLSKCLSTEKKTQRWDLKMQHNMKKKKLKVHETSETDDQINFGILSHQLLFFTKRRIGEMWGKILTGKVSQELGWKFQSGKGFYNINFGIICELWYFC